MTIYFYNNFIYIIGCKQGPQGPQKLSSLKLLLNSKPPTDTGYFYSSNYQKTASLWNSKKQNCKENPNRFTNNGNIAEKAKHPVSESLISNYREDELLIIP